jgi:hypothetical protein
MATEPTGTTTPPPAKPDPWDDGGPNEPAPEHKKKDPVKNPWDDGGANEPAPEHKKKDPVKNPWDDGGANEPAPGTH